MTLLLVTIIAKWKSERHEQLSKPTWLIAPRLLKKVPPLIGARTQTSTARPTEYLDM